jgi:hypothetical protein
VGGQVFQGNGGGGGKMALQSDGRILVFSGLQGGSLVRYKTDGNLDTTFDGDGVASDLAAHDDPNLSNPALI